MVEPRGGGGERTEMQENPSESSSTANITTVKRYAPHNQRSRSLSKRKSGGDRLEKMNNNNVNDGEKNQVATSRNFGVIDRRDAVGINQVNENSHTGLIPLHGCSKSKAFQLLSDRWAAATNAFNDPSIDLAERPVMYSGSAASAWGQFRLPHQMISRTGSGGPSSGSQMDFLRELQRAINDANTSSNT